MIDVADATMHAIDAAVIPEAIRSRLSPGEQVLWHGQPRQGIVFRASDALMIPFSLFWGGFAIYWEWLALRMDAPWFFKLWGIPFVLFGLYIIVGRFFWDARQRQRTHYALTGERAIIAIESGRGGVQSVRLKNLAEVGLNEHSDGLGTLTLGAPLGLGAFASWLPAGWPSSKAYLPPRFDMIADARRVEQLIRTTQQRA